MTLSLKQFEERKAKKRDEAVLSRLREKVTQLECENTAMKIEIERLRSELERLRWL